MKRIVLAMICLVALFLSAFTGLAAAGQAEPTLHVYTWSDYLDSEVLYAFEKQYKCRVAVDYFDSNEAMYAKLKAGGGGYDVMTPSSYMSSIMYKQGMIRELDHGALPNLVHMDRSFTKFTEDPGMAYSVPYTRTVSGVGYNSRRIPESDTGSWDIFANPAYAKRMTMLNDMRETIGAALKRLGYSLNTTNEVEIESAGDLVISWKGNLAKFDVDEAKIGLGAGEFSAIHGYNGDVALIIQENPDIKFFVPREGSSLASDDWVVAVDTPVADLAHAFINHMLDPEIAAENMESIRYYMPNLAAIELLSDELRNEPAFNVPDDALEKCEVIRDLGGDNMKYVRVWDRIKAY